SNVEQHLPASPQNVPGHSPANSTGFLGKIYLSTIAVGVVLSAVLTGTILYFSSEKSVSKEVIAQNLQLQPEKAVVSLAPAPPIDETAPVTPSVNTVTEKQ